MQWLAQALKRGVGNGWAASAGLSLLTVLVFLEIDNRFNPGLELRSPPWSLIPVFVGALVLNTKQQSLLVFVFFVLELGYYISYGLEPGDALVSAMVLRRILILLALIWAAQIHTRLKQQSRALHNSELQLMQKLAQSLKAAALAHELRQPLSQLLLQSRLSEHRLEQQVAHLEELKATLQEIQASGSEIDRVVRAISDLLHDSSPSPQPVDLVKVVNTCLARLQPALAKAKVELMVSGLEQPRMVEGQRDQLEIACCNLLSNAMQALQQQQQRGLLAVAISTHHEQQELTVADSGPGLPSTHLRELVMNSSKPNGMGVGLLTVQSITTRQGGELLLGQSPQLGGAEVRLRLPQWKGHPN